MYRYNGDVFCAIVDDLPWRLQVRRGSAKFIGRAILLLFAQFAAETVIRIFVRYEYIGVGDNIELVYYNTWIDVVK